MEFPVIGVVIPCFNEESVIRLTFKKINSVLETLKNDDLVHSKSFLCFVDDGSDDSTWQIIKELQSQYQNVMGIKLTRNYGHQAALMAGMSTLLKDCDGVITIDADLQDDVNVIPKMIDYFKNGKDIIYAVRGSRNKDTILKKMSAQFYYRLMFLLGANIVYNHADYRLLSRKVLTLLLQYREKNLFLRGLVPLLSGNSEIVYFSRDKRMAGDSKYPWRKMLYFAWDGITSFSTVPLGIVTCFGAVVCFSCFLLIVYYFLSWSWSETLPGWVSTVLPIYFLGGIQLLSLGVIGEYIGKIYTEVKNRPLFNIEKIKK